jgi:hypothetical protein
VGAVACGAIIACSFSTNHGVVDGNMIDTPHPPPDAGPCTMQSAECFGDVLRTCSGSGVLPEDTTCNWGCGSARCLQIVPAGGAVMPGDVGLGSDALLDISLGSGTVINGDDGSIGKTGTMVRRAGTGVVDGIDFEDRAGSAVAMFRFKSLQISGMVRLQGHRAIALVADGPIDIAGIVDAQGGCIGTHAGPGGFVGGMKGSAGDGLGGGSGSGDQNQGGGGGGYGGIGGTGGNGGDVLNPIAGGSAYGDDAITILVGGAGGGGGGKGGGGQTGTGGGGGGAVQFVSNTHIEVISGGINAGGCGGRDGSGANDGGGGGGAGGTILLEAPAVHIVGALAVNGGAGGGGAAMNTAYASAGTLNRNPAPGNTGGAVGGIGGAANMLDGTAGGTTGGKGGGGGGGVGRIRINTRAGSASVDTAAVLSPSFDDQPTTCTQGPATLQ